MPDIREIFVKYRWPIAWNFIELALAGALFLAVVAITSVDVRSSVAVIPLAVGAYIVATGALRAFLNRRSAETTDEGQPCN